MESTPRRGPAAVAYDERRIGFLERPAPSPRARLIQGVWVTIWGDGGLKNDRLAILRTSVCCKGIGFGAERVDVPIGVRERTSTGFVFSLFLRGLGLQLFELGLGRAQGFSDVQRGTGTEGFCFTPVPTLTRIL